MNYYYLAASLPALSWDSPPDLSIEAFKNLCRAHLADADWHGLADLDEGLETSSTHPFVREWRNAEIQLRNALVRQRAARHRRDPAPLCRPHSGYDPGVERIVAEAYAKPDPLQRERTLDRFRWQKADELAGLNGFAPRALLAYAVKLKLAERWTTMEDEDGLAIANAIVDRQPHALSEAELK